MFSCLTWALVPSRGTLFLFSVSGGSGGQDEEVVGDGGDDDDSGTPFSPIATIDDDQYSIA